METKTGNSEDFMKLIGLKWTILKELYDGEMSPKEISDKLGKKLPWISIQLKILEDNGLVTARRSEDGRSKLCSLAENCRNICAAIIKAQATHEEPEKVSYESLALTLTALEDDELPGDVRSAAAFALNRLCSRENGIEEGKEDLRAFLLKIIDELEQYVAESNFEILNALENYLGHNLGPSELMWFKEECHAKLLLQFHKEKEIETRIRTIGILSRAYYRCRDIEEFSEMADELSQFFTETYFDPDEEEKIADKSWEIFFSMKGNERKIFIKRLYEGAKSEDDKIKERCTKRLKGILASYGSTRTKGKLYEVSEDDSVDI